MLARLITEFSEISLEDALAKAMAKAAKEMGETHDLQISIVELIKLAEKKFKATIEIRIIPMTNRHRLKVQGLDTELRLAHDKAFRAVRKAEELHPRQMVLDHLQPAFGNFVPEVPDFYVREATEAAMQNHFIENQFFHATHHAEDVPQSAPDVPELHKVLGKKHLPHPKLDIDAA